MKKLLTAITSAVLCMTMLILAPTQIVASAADNTEKKYISEVKVGMGVTSDQASKELLDEGYTILKDDSGNYADLNKDAGAKSPMKPGPNQKIVYLGYKTTAKASDAITDLAVMNMEGGYSFEEYEKVMNDHLDTQIKPFVNRFIATLKEYRENLQKPKDSANFKRAYYYNTLLNKLTDDDCDGNALGDLLINQTKYEMGDEAYNKLDDAQKNRHCDILTLLMQGNGQAVQLMETMLTKASDSSNSTWIDRFKDNSLDNLTEAVQNENPNMTPSEINAELDKKYNDDAKRILDKWSEFNEILLNYDIALQKSNEVVKTKINSEEIKLDENSTKEDVTKAVNSAYKAEETMVKGGMAAEDIAVHDYLENAGYGDGTMLEFFERDKSEFEDSENIRELYPIVDSLTGGQLAGLDFLSIKDMILMAVTDENGYKEVDMKDVQPASIYQDVNREIYDKGGVALTDAALRAKATAQETEKTFELSKTGIVLWSCTTAMGLAAIGSAVAWKSISSNTAHVKKLNDLVKKVDEATKAANGYAFAGEFNEKGERIYKRETQQALWDQQDMAEKELKQYKEGEFEEATRRIATKSKVCKFLTAGFTVLGAILAGVSIYMTVEEMKAYYKVTFTPVPKYIVDRADITAVNQKGETVMIKNQTAYYKAVLCNRTEGSSNVEKENYRILGDRNDLNGDVGMQWLSLYSVKYENGTPILADSLKLKMGNGDMPEGYTNGIHRFGEKDVVFNLTSRLFCYNDPNDGTYVYFKNDTSTVKDLTAAGSTFSGGSLAIGVAAGLLGGAALTLILLFSTRKRRENQPA